MSQCYSLRLNLLSLFAAILGFFPPYLQLCYLARTSTSVPRVKPSRVSAYKILLWTVCLSQGVRKPNPLVFTWIQPLRTSHYIIMTILYFWCLSVLGLSVLGFGQQASPIAALFGGYFCLRSWGKDAISDTWTSLFQVHEEKLGKPPEYPWAWKVLYPIS